MKTTTLLNISLLISAPLCAEFKSTEKPSAVTKTRVHVEVDKKQVKTSAQNAVASAGTLVQDVGTLAKDSATLAQQEAELAAQQAIIAAEHAAEKVGANIEKVGRKIDNFATHTAVTTASQVSQAGKSIGYYTGQAVGGVAQLADSLLYPAAIYFAGKVLFNKYVDQHVSPTLEPSRISSPWSYDAYHAAANLLTGALAYSALYSVATSPAVAKFIRTNMPHTARLLGHVLLEEEGLIYNDVTDRDVANRYTPTF